MAGMGKWLRDEMMPQKLIITLSDDPMNLFLEITNLIIASVETLKTAKIQK